MFNGTAIVIPCWDVKGENQDSASAIVSENVEQEKKCGIPFLPQMTDANIKCFVDFRLWSDVNQFCDRHFLGLCCPARHANQEEPPGWRLLSLEETLFITLQQRIPRLWLPTPRFECPEENIESLLLRRSVNMTPTDRNPNYSNLGDPVQEETELEESWTSKRRRRHISQREPSDISPKISSISCLETTSWFMTTTASSSHCDKHHLDSNDKSMGKCDLHENENIQPNKIFKMALFISSDKIRTRMRIAVYLWWKQRGWIVKNGLKFGVDFLLYDKSPESVHARYSLVIVSAQMKWRAVNLLSRLASTVAKDLIISTTTIDDSLLTDLNLEDVVNLSLVQVKVSRAY